jgi:hypothetical protein
MEVIDHPYETGNAHRILRCGKIPNSQGAGWVWPILVRLVGLLGGLSDYLPLSLCPITSGALSMLLQIRFRVCSKTGNRITQRSVDRNHALLPAHKW